MHTHQSVWKSERPTFAGNLYADLSETARLLHRRDHQARQGDQCFTNPTTNSYKRLIPGFEAPVLMAYSARNRSAACRIPIVSSPKAKRVEVALPRSRRKPLSRLCGDADGRARRHPEPHPSGRADDKNLYDLPPEELKTSRRCVARYARPSANCRLITPSC